MISLLCSDLMLERTPLSVSGIIFDLDVYGIGAPKEMEKYVKR